MKPKMLLIDDEEGIRKLLGISLRDAGYPLAIAIDGEHGLDLFREEKPEIVLTDIKMPGMDGIEVLRRIKAERPDTEVIVITGHGEMELAVQSLQLDASDFITKPIHDEALFVALRRAEEKLAWRRTLREYNETLETRVREATAELKKNYAFQEKLLQSSLDGLVGTDEEGRVVLFNSSAQTLSGYSLEEVRQLSRPLEQLLPEWAAFVARSVRELAAAELKITSLIRRSRLFRKSGEEISVRLSGALLLEQDRITGAVCFLQDQRELDRLQRDLLRSERLAATGQTVAGMAHAIKNILGGLKGGRFMVNKGLELNERQYLWDGWAMVERNIEKVARLSLDLLNFCRDREPELEQIDPNGPVREVFDLYRERANQLGIRLNLDLEETRALAKLDPQGMHEVLANLVSNAIDACALADPPPAQPEIVLRSRYRPEGGLLLEVRDNGPGIPEDVRKKLFTIFFSTKGSRGTGLGLLLSQKIVQEHGGEIRVQSAPGQGATFQIFLPETLLVGAEEPSAGTGKI
jgi:two-component system NtrC family sensor kinase